MTIAWDDLTKDEQAALKRMNRGAHPVPIAMAERLVSLGLAVERSNGIGISRAGRQLVIDILLGAHHE